ncbi:hypothetical protein KOAAANKH_03472 [Brevundimonas sp. NIBR10]|jgi:hypothetical protein|uniref:hypothetical protein n=1 Tax=Brevundimonas sp. NIBR10 TaxID=3015997 RepID=UPI0022F1B085|nr:hypothetical protein [Brevundimonas sp. NIBR10]WGM48570.1 hypothetical protein KOAAANKH_03472 [Brevundimonas sp. NIBR10]
MTLSFLAPVLLLVAIAVLLSTPKFRSRPGAKLGVAISAVGAVAIGFSAIGYQIGKDAALRDNRADAAAAAEAARP